MNDLQMVIKSFPMLMRPRGHNGHERMIAQESADMPEDRSIPLLSQEDKMNRGPDLGKWISPREVQDNWREISCRKGIEYGTK
jgi:hypothetical protein